MTTPPPADVDAFRAFEHAGWQDTTPQYHHALGALTTQAIGPLLDAVRVGKGMYLLDVATGPGYAAAAAAHRGSDAIGTDFSAAMVAQARQLHPTVEFREGDAEALPFPEESFDAVVMNFGLLHFPQPERALGEAHRVLRHGGRVGFTVWTKPEEAVGFHIVLRAIETHGNMNVPLPPGPPFFRFSDPDECHRVLLEAGFVTPHIDQVAQVWRLDSPDALYQAILNGTVRTGALLRAQSSEALTAIRTAMRDAARAYEPEGIIALPMPAVLASAVKP
ncbi:MAG: class I SAM-dependent methyltransferase [Candidatus Binatia bacterium]